MVPQEDKLRLECLYVCITNPGGIYLAHDLNCKMLNIICGWVMSGTNE